MRYAALLTVVVSLLLVSCVPSSPIFVREPAGGVETLVIGRVLLENQYYKAGSVPIGNYGRNVTLEFEDVDTGKKQKAKGVDAKGFFFLHNPPSSRLRLVRFSFHSSQSQVEYHPKPGTKKKSVWKDKGADTAMKPRVQRVYEIEPGKVNNLGYFQWIANLQSRTHRLLFNREYEETRAAFAERYPESLWNGKDWVPVRGEKP
jgi:hypothetical protein